MRRGIFKGAVICILILSMYLGNLSYQLEERLSTIEICEGDGLIGGVETESINSMKPTLF